MTASSISLPARVGRVVPADETRPPISWLVEGLIAEGEVTAFAIADPKARAALGMAVVRALLDSPAAAQTILDRQVVDRVESIIVLSTSRQSMWLYRTSSQGDTRVIVVDLYPQLPADGNYWPALYKLASDVAAGLLVVDTVQDITNGSTSASMMGQLEQFGRTVVALYRGNETKAGVGGEALWSAAHQRFWHEPRTGLMHPVDARLISEPWAVDVSAVGPPQVQLSGEAEQVRQTAVLARAVGIFDPDAGTSLGKLLEIDSGSAVATLWATRQRGTILPALGRHQAVWMATISGLPIPTGTGPNF